MGQHRRRGSNLANSRRRGRSEGCTQTGPVGRRGTAAAEGAPVPTSALRGMPMNAAASSLPRHDEAKRTLSCRWSKPRPIPVDAGLPGRRSRTPRFSHAHSMMSVTRTSACRFFAWGRACLDFRFSGRSWNPSRAAIWRFDGFAVPDGSCRGDTRSRMACSAERGFCAVQSHFFPGGAKRRPTTTCREKAWMK